MTCQSVPVNHRQVGEEWFLYALVHLDSNNIFGQDKVLNVQIGMIAHVETLLESTLTITDVIS